MVLSNLQQNFIVYFADNFFYPEVNYRWLPLVKKRMLPYTTLEDFINAQIQSFDFPTLALQPQTQQLGRRQIYKRQGQSVDEGMDKILTITFKLTEGYLSYFILRHQLDLFYKIQKVKPLYWSPLNVDILDDFGRAILTYEHEQITPDTMSELNLSYAAKLSTYNTFTLGVKYNYLNIWYMDTVSEKIYIQNEN